MPEKFEVGDIVVCMDDSPWAGIWDMDVLKKGKAYEVLRASMARDIFVPESRRAWKSERFRRATLSEIRKYRKEQGYEKHRFAIGDIVVAIAVGGTVNLGRVCTVSAVHIDDAGECFVDLDGGRVVGMYYAANFRKATPAEVEVYHKANEKATASLVAGTTIVPGQLVTVSISDKPPFQAVVLEAPTANDPYVKLSSAAGIDWASKAELAPTFNVTFTWESPEKMPLTGNDAPEAINKAIAVPNPQMLTSADGREFDIIDWKPTVSTGEVVKVEANMVVRQAKDKPKSLTDGLVGAWAPKPAAAAWQPKPGDLVVCVDAEDSAWMLEAGKVYEVTVGACNTTHSIGLGGHSLYYRIGRFRPATHEERLRFLSDKKRQGGPDFGYRFLDKDEIVDEGDEYWAADARTWILAMKVGLPASTLDLYRRRNKFAEGELVQIIKPATVQERGRWPGWYDSMDCLSGLVLPMPKLADIVSSSLHNRPAIRAPGHDHITWEVAVDWLAPATKAQKEAYETREKVKKAKIQELEARMKDIQSELSSLKGA